MGVIFDFFERDENGHALVEMNFLGPSDYELREIIVGRNLCPRLNFSGKFGRIMACAEKQLFFHLLRKKIELTYAMGRQ